MGTTQGTNTPTQGTRKEHARNAKDNKYWPRPWVWGLALDQSSNLKDLAPTQGTTQGTRKELRKGHENVFSIEYSIIIL